VGRPYEKQRAGLKPAPTKYNHGEMPMSWKTMATLRFWPCHPDHGRDAHVMLLWNRPENFVAAGWSLTPFAWAGEIVFAIRAPAIEFKIFYHVKVAK